MSTTNTPESQKELSNTLNYLKNIESILQKSHNPEQRTRLQKEFERYKSQLCEILPGIDFRHMSLDKIIEENNIEIQSMRSSTSLPKDSSHGKVAKNISSFLTNLSIKKASVHCTDQEVNFIFTTLTLIERVYFLSLSDTYCLMDFTHINKRNKLRFKLDTVLKTLNSLTKIIDQHGTLGANASTQNSAQLKVRSRQTLLLETDDFINEMHGYLKDILDVENTDKNIIQNLDEKIELSSLHKRDVPELDGKSLREVLNEFYQICFETGNYLSLPGFKK